MDRQWVVGALLRRGIEGHLKGSDPIDGSYPAEQRKSKICDQLSRIEWTYGRVDGLCRCMHPKVERVATSKIKSIGVRPSSICAPFAVARADVCTQKLREWRLAGSNVSVLDLQVYVHRLLWLYQTVLISGQKYCLTCMGSMWHHPSCRELLVSFEWKISAYNGQCLPTLTMCT